MFIQPLDGDSRNSVYANYANVEDGFFLAKLSRAMTPETDAETDETIKRKKRRPTGFQICIAVISARPWINMKSLLARQAVSIRGRDQNKRAVTSLERG
jgi:hypothetical protein